MALDETYPVALPQGTILAGQYVIEKALGQGGFGITYKAKDHKTGQSVAVKEFFPETMAVRTTQTTVTAFSGARGESFAYGKGCFLQEAETLAQFIGNENIVRVYSYFEENGTAYFVMEFVEGTSFDQYIKDHGGKVPYEEAEKILLPIIDALALVHAKGIVHRDVTPDNIYITKDGKVKLLDFGAARYSLGDKSRSLDVVLKHGFAPREQYTRHGRQGAFTDVYTVGASFYFAITGRRPPDSIDRMDEDILIPPSSLGVKIEPEKEDAILTAMSVQPSSRYQTMVDFRKALMSAGETETQPSASSQAQPGMSQAQASTSPQVQQRVFTSPQPAPVQEPQPIHIPQQNISQQAQNVEPQPIPQSASVQGTQEAEPKPIPVQQEQNDEPQPEEKERKKKTWIRPAGICAGILAAVAIIIAAVSSGGNAKKEPVVASNTITEPEPNRNTVTEPEPVIEPEVTPASEFEYTIAGGMVTITEYKGKEASVVIPSEMEGGFVGEIGKYAFYNCSSLTSVTIPDSVTRIGSWAFRDCSSLSSVTILGSVTEIGSSAFCNCSSLSSITIPDRVTRIWDYAFCGCSSLSSVTIPDSVTKIGGHAFYNCSSLTSAIIPEHTIVADDAFENCPNLTITRVSSTAD